jgi:hypothetical protein
VIQFTAFSYKPIAIRKASIYTTFWMLSTFRKAITSAIFTSHRLSMMSMKEFYSFLPFFT